MVPIAEPSTSGLEGSPSQEPLPPAGVKHRPNGALALPAGEQQSWRQHRAPRIAAATQAELCESPGAAPNPP